MCNDAYAPERRNLQYSSSSCVPTESKENSSLAFTSYLAHRRRLVGKVINGDAQCSLVPVSIRCTSCGAQLAPASVAEDMCFLPLALLRHAFSPQQLCLEALRAADGGLKWNHPFYLTNPSYANALIGFPNLQCSKIFVISWRLVPRLGKAGRNYEDHRPTHTAPLRAKT